jgi:hypothetical protein
MNLLSTTAVVAGALLACSAANAQPAPNPAPAPSEAQGPSAPVAINASATVDADGLRHVVVANAPVADTPENRAKYGQPMSHAGRHTRAAGN